MSPSLSIAVPSSRPSSPEYLEEDGRRVASFPALEGEAEGEDFAPSSPREPTVAVPVSAAPTRVYYGWVILPLAMLAMVATAPGQTFGVSIFNEPMRQSLALSHGEMAAAYTLGTLLGAIPMMFVGAVMDRYGLRKTLLAVLSLFCLACGFTCFVNSWAMLAAAFFLLRMLGPGAISLLSGNILPFWFEQRLGMVEGLRSFAYACSMATVPALNLYLINGFGWRGAYAILGCGIWIALFPIYFWRLRNNPAEVGQQIDGGATPAGGSRSVTDGSRSRRQLKSPVGRGDEDQLGGRNKADRNRPARPGPGVVDLSLAEALGTYSFWIASLGTALFGLVMTAIFFCLVPICEERGLDERHAAQMMLVYAISLAAMQLIGGMLADRFSAPPLMACGLLTLAAGVTVLHLATQPALAIAAGGILGGSLGIHSGASQPLWARYFGRRHLGKIRGFLMTMNIGLSSIGPLVAGLAHDQQGNFDSAMWLFIALPLPLALLSCFATPPCRSVAAIVAPTAG